ncbi:MAG: methylated-DNA/protein-cysteinemethyltransferase, partial [Pedosphaera sp.]|nr:methylated-DNA/protein-cysteinemethyltransferase [Pedosphaera sp.]
MKTLDIQTLPVSEMERAWSKRDESYDGVFFCAVRTTGIFCRPSCPSRPKRENLEFFRSVKEAIGAGYRPCKRCQPELVDGQPPEWIAKLMQRVMDDPEARINAADLRAQGLTPEKVRRWFQEHYGMTFAAWCRGQRLSTAFTSIRNGAPLDDVILGHGYESHSGFREAFSRTFGAAPGKSRQGTCLRVTLLTTPLGPMLAAASETSICLLEFADRRGLEHGYAVMRKKFGLPVVPGTNEVLSQLERELREYFDGKRRDFSVPLVLKGTAFQEDVWRELRRIPFGETASYGQIATRVGRPSAVRAVAQA